MAGSRASGRKARILRLYAALYEAYGPRGWWPLVRRAGKRGFDEGGYHPGDYESPRTAADRLSVSLGAILTQNASWTNADRALRAMEAAGLIDVGALLGADTGVIEEAARPSGYFRQKTRKIKVFAEAAAEGRWFSRGKPPSREGLLGLWGIGEETADSILLYAFRVPVFVMDAYGRRILSRLGLTEDGASYAEARSLMADSMPERAEDRNECHALFVELAKRSCRKTPECGGCPVRKDCPFRARGV